MLNSKLTKWLSISFLLTVVGSYSASLFAAEPVQTKKLSELNSAQKLEDLAYGNILFEYYRGNTIKALNAILVAQKRKALPNHANQAQLLSGVIYLDLGMLNEAQKIFNQLLTEQDLKSQLLAKLEFYLGKLHYKQGDFTQAEFRLFRVYQSIETQLQDEALLMLSNISLANNQLADAKNYLTKVSANSKLLAFSHYNLAMIELKNGNLAEAERLLSLINPVYTDSQTLKSLKDKSFTALGYFALANKNYAKARESFLKVRLDSPSTNKALLGIGWSYFEDNKPQQALKHWLKLQQKDIRDVAVQESLLAIPYAYQQLQSMQLSLDNYTIASEKYQQQIDFIDAFKIKVINEDLVENYLLNALETQRNALDEKSVKDIQLFGDKYDYYLFELLSEHEFNEDFRSYQKLGQLAKILTRWDEQLPIFDEIIKANELRFSRKLPQIKKYLNQDAFNDYELQINQLKSDIKEVKNNQNLHLLANKQQLEIYARVSRVNQTIKRLPEDMINELQRQKARRASGILQWQFELNKAEKIWHLEKLQKQISKLLSEIKQRKLKLAKANELSINRFDGYETQVSNHKAKVASLKEKIKQQINLQASALKQQIIAVLDVRRSILDNYLLQSDLSVARLHEKSVLIPEADDDE